MTYVMILIYLRLQLNIHFFVFRTFHFAKTALLKLKFSNTAMSFFISPFPGGRFLNQIMQLNFGVYINNYQQPPIGKLITNPLLRHSQIHFRKTSCESYRKRSTNKYENKQNKLLIAMLFNRRMIICTLTKSTRQIAEVSIPYYWNEIGAYCWEIYAIAYQSVNIFCFSITNFLNGQVSHTMYLQHNILSYLSFEITDLSTICELTCLFP